MTTVLLVIGGVMAMGAVLSNIKGRCPSCGKRSLVTEYDRWAKGNAKFPPGVPRSLTRYRCKACDTKWVSHDFGPLIPGEAYDAGTREVPPEARALAPKKGPPNKQDSADP